MNVSLIPLLPFFLRSLSLSTHLSRLYHRVALDANARAHRSRLRSVANRISTMGALRRFDMNCIY